MDINNEEEQASLALLVTATLSSLLNLSVCFHCIPTSLVRHSALGGSPDELCDTEPPAGPWVAVAPPARRVEQHLGRCMVHGWGLGLMNLSAPSSIMVKSLLNRWSKKPGLIAERLKATGWTERTRVSTSKGDQKKVLMARS